METIIKNATQISKERKKQRERLMSDTTKAEGILLELEEQATTDARRFLQSPTSQDKLTVVKREVDGAFAFITVQSPKGRKITLRYAWRTKQLIGTV